MRFVNMDVIRLGCYFGGRWPPHRDFWASSPFPVSAHGGAPTHACGSLHFVTRDKQQMRFSLASPCLD
ncbi:hypothetical protein I7I50_04007 [Histoplasma capsulatum G186AR]|uniref:Uncharacterized protein n=1 Tax=Ajellomyces capsulatus TaxID=5037 RepID=A0A8H7YP60_AJECA|nr:hypothetical protein I7I52_04915 [Histoplasma capsulatum]QSS75013.1 hypothetical protein I7I50_04007 [Histoplasma capsulatum G186AR]